MKVEWKVDRDVQKRAWSRIRAVTGEVSKMVPEAKVIIDVGGGAGWFGLHLAEAHPRASVISVDTVPRPGESKVTHLKASALDVPVSNGKADIVGANAILHHVPDSLDRCISEVARVLKPGGLFLTQEPLADNPIARLVRGAVTTDIHEEGECPLEYEVLESAINSHLEIVKTEFHFLTSYIAPHLVARMPSLKGVGLVLVRFDEKALENLPGLRAKAAYVSIIARKPQVQLSENDRKTRS